MWSKDKTDFDRFVDAFMKRYRAWLEDCGVALDDQVQLYWLYLQFKGSEISPEEWLERQELV